jgi:hypothetical protein
MQDTTGECMTDTKKNENETASVDNQIEAALRTVLHYRVVLPDGVSMEENAATVEEVSKAVIEAIQLKCKDVPGMTLNYNSAYQLPDGVDIPLL